jgi:hypothetical protein
MTYVPTEKYAPRVTLHGDQLGLEDGNGNDYLTGRNYRGSRVSGVQTLSGTFPNLISKSTSGTVLGADYKTDNFIRNIDFFDDFLGKTLSTRWNTNIGSNGSCALAIHADQAGGAVRLTSGAGSTFTMAVNGVQMTGDKNWLVSNGGLVYEMRAGNMSSAANQSVFMGLIDTDSAEAAFTISGGTVTANATNGVGFCQDAAGTNTALNAVAVNAGGSPQVVVLTNALSTTGYHIYRVEVDPAGNANFFIDYLQVATIPLAVATTALLAPTASLLAETAASQTLDADFAWCQGLRT